MGSVHSAQGILQKKYLNKAFKSRNTEVQPFHKTVMVESSAGTYKKRRKNRLKLKKMIILGEPFANFSSSRGLQQKG